MKVRAQFDRLRAEFARLRAQFARLRAQLFGVRAESELPAWPEMTALSDILKSLSDIWPKLSDISKIVSDISRSMSDKFITMSEISKKAGRGHYTLARPVPLLSGRDQLLNQLDQHTRNQSHFYVRKVPNEVTKEGSLLPSSIHSHNRRNRVYEFK